MKKHIKKLLYSLLIAFMSIGINFDADARLPKYMAQRAAELLIEKSNLQLKSTTLINNYYVKLKEDVILPSISSALSNYIKDGKIEDFVEKIIENIKQTETEKDKVEKEKFTEAISNKDIQSRLIVAIKALDKASKQFTEQVAIALKNAIIENEQAIYAYKLVDFLYCTEKRQHLANWMKRRLPFKVHGTPVAWEKDENDFKNLLDDIDEAFNDTEVFRTFVNQHFPCWTGTLTCFMLNKGNVAKEAFLRKRVVDTCRNSIGTEIHAQKVVSILFALELVDNWHDIQQICEKEGEKGDIERLKEPHFVDFDPYECVPVSNTMYKTDSSSLWMPKNTQGSCMVSTIRNLLYILCRSKQDSKEIITTTMREDIRDAFLSSIYTVPGTTSCETLKYFGEKILPRVTTQYQPTLELFVCSLNSLLCVDSQETIAIPTPQQYVFGILGINEKVITNILKKITNHGDNITVMLNNIPAKLCSDWPESCLIVNDRAVNKKITIAFGHRGAGHHIEIIDIKQVD